MFDFENLGQCREVQHSQWSYLMVNINLYISRSSELVATSHRFQDISILKCCDLENLGQGHDIQHSQWRHSMAIVNL